MKNLQISSIRRHKGAFLAVLALLSLLAALLSLFLGSVRLSPAEVLAALGGDAGSAAGKIVLYSRLPRTLAALLAGAALAAAGVLIQTVLHNPLASPGIMGVNSGALLAVAIVCAVNPLAQPYASFVAFLGALGAAFLVLFLAERTGASRMTVILAGVAVSNLFSAGVDAVVSLVPEALTGISDFRIGGFHGITVERLAPAAPWILLSLLLALSLCRELDVLALGEDTARSLGLGVRGFRALLLLLAAALTGAAVSFSGLLGFVGLIVPHALRRLLGEESLPLLLGSILGGSFFVTLCDLAARLLFAPHELPVGVVLSFLGAPFFLWLLFRSRGGRV